MQKARSVTGAAECRTLSLIPGHQCAILPSNMSPSSRRQADFRDLLTSKGLRITEQRLLLLQELAKVTSPISHPELTERMDGSGMDRATVYRNLLTLAEAGVLIRAQLGDNVTRFELPRTMSSDHSHHPHLVCTECGNVRCLPANAVKLRGEAADSEVAEVQLRGRCVKCVGA
ncbi:MAG: Zinc uptake regulation protein [Polyangiaceae bacterium]|nr:Zinc uptake regulation protein [Polyangiaceae bacterium]